MPLPCLLFTVLRPAFHAAVRPILLTCAVLGAGPARAMTVENLKVEYQARPVGLEVTEPRFSWTLAAEERGQRQTAYQVLVASSAERLSDDQADVWDSGRQTGADNFGLAYAGPGLESDQWYHWKVRVWDRDGNASPWSAPSRWHMGFLTPDAWTAQWIGAPATSTSPLLRRTFQVGGDVVQATAYVYAVGWYELYLNGQKVGDQVLAPVNSNYTKGLFYDVLDVTERLRAGGNAVGLWLGQGYNENYSKYGYRWQQPMAARLQLELTYADGRQERIVTDERWRTAPSPITSNHIYDGESYDARREQPGWATAAFDDAAWSPVEPRQAPAAPLHARAMPPIKVMATRPPVAISQPQPGVFVYDLGQNFAGWVRIEVKGPAGTTIQLRHAETLHPDGMLDLRTNREARALDAFTLGGRGVETYEPRFTYHGFRYVEVTGLTPAVQLSRLEGRVVHAAVGPAGAFSSSHPLLDRIQENFLWSLRSNLMGIPTDTATRDERTPCLMDSLAVEETAMFNLDLRPYYTKWLQDIRGDVSMPPNWAGDQVILPALLYWHYGDRRILEQHLDNMKQATDALAAQAEAKGYWADGFGDWAAPNVRGDYESSFSEGEIVNTAYLFRAAQATAEAAAVLGRSEDAARYNALAGEVAQHFQARHYRPATQTYGSGRQVTSVLPLAFGLVPDELRAPVARALHARVVGPDRAHLDTGIFGTRYLFEVLIDHGFGDTAFRALTQETYPSFGHQIALGATTTWEQWSYAGGMQTHNHAMFAGPGVTFYTHLAGIRPAAPGFRRIIIRPFPPDGLTKASARLETMMGTVASAWRKDDDYHHQVTIPVNATARVYLPAGDGQRIWEGLTPVQDARGVQVLGPADGMMVLEVESGRYEFRVESARP